jgi:GPH family glycoside/pentoside/hexuronide:cation symporter
MLMSWIPSLITILTAFVMFFYPLTESKLDEITSELNTRRLQEK